MKTIFLFVFLVIITGCSSSFNLIDDKNRPVEGAIVVSEINDYLFQKWSVQIDVTDSEGVANSLVGREVVYKKGFHPIINGNDVSGVSLKSIILRGNVKIYPIKNPLKYKYYMRKKWIKIEEFSKNKAKNNQFVDIEINHCKGVTATYSIKDKIFRIKSDHKNLSESSRFFYETASNKRKKSYLSSEENIFFYCTNNNQSIYKTGISFRLRTSIRIKDTKKLVSTYIMTMMISKIDSLNSSIEPEIKPTNPLRGRGYIQYYSKYRFPKIVLLKRKAIILNAIKENIPTRTREEKELKRLLLLAVRKK